MSFFTLLLLAIGLAMDAMAVAGTRGLAARTVRPRDALRVGIFFGVAQAIMPAIGWFAGAHFASKIAAWDHWIIFGVLGALGAKMIYESLEAPAAEASADASGANAFGLRILALLALATSIDALAAGVTLAMVDVNVVWACSLIGVVTGVLSFAGVYVGRRFGARLGKRLDAVGGLVLIGIGIKTLIEHLRG